ncbi:MAG: phage terminase large subunit [Pyrinomonadaceae bacterium]
MKKATPNDIRQKMKADINRTRKALGMSALEFPQWLPTVTPQWTWDWPHQKFLYERLDLVSRGVIKRLMIFMPPRHTKTETVTVRYGAYRLEQNPKLNIILGCYNQKLANRFSRKTLRIAKSRMPLSTDRKAVEEWETLMGGGLRAVGVGGGVTGFGADLILIDDPVKNREEAESETYRDKCWEWFNDDLYTRLEPGGSIILTMTRWHDDDLAGRLIKEMDEGGEKWEVVTLPAIAEEDDPMGRRVGTALCPARYDEAKLLEVKQKLGPYSFSALYQQSPTPREGGLFKREWFGRDKILDEEPPNLRWARGYDLAVSTKTSADYTASFRCAFTKSGDLVISGGFRKRIEFPEQLRYAVKRMVEEKSTRHGVEKALHGEALVQSLRRVPAVRGVPLRSVTVDKDKFTRALGWAELAEAGKVYLVRGNWNDTFLDEVCRFTGRNDPHDDQVDAVSIAVKMLGRGGRTFAF